MSKKQRITGREITQTRAVQTREKLLMAALKLYAKKGYHNTTVDEIAKSANLSVGTAYRYFGDKKELLLAALEYGFSHIAEFANVSETDLFDMNLEQSLKAFEKFHKDYYALHEELEGLRHTDRDVALLYNEFSDKALKNLYEKFPEEIKRKAHSFENLRIAIGLMENHCHYYMHENSDDNTLDFMRNRTLELVKYILS